MADDHRPSKPTTHRDEAPNRPRTPMGCFGACGFAYFGRSPPPKWARPFVGVNRVMLSTSRYPHSFGILPARHPKTPHQADGAYWRLNRHDDAAKVWAQSAFAETAE